MGVYSVVTQLVKALATKLDDLSSIPGPTWVKGKS